MIIVVKRTTPPCTYCQQAVSTLKRRGIPYQEVELETVADWFKEQGYRSVPQIFKDELMHYKRIGGFEDLQRYLANPPLSDKEG